MQLHCVTPDAFEDYSVPTGGKYLGQSHDYFESSKGTPTHVVARFNRFGGGKYRKSDYEVVSEWQDVEELIERFCEAGHPAALALKYAKQMSEAIQTLGWKPPGI